MDTDVVLLILAGVWLGIGFAHGTLMWSKNPQESTRWRIFSSLALFIVGPISYIWMSEWASPPRDIVCINCNTAPETE